MKKTVIVLFVALILAFSLVGCGGGSGSTDTSDKNLINALLDNVQTATTSMDVDKMVSLCTYPFTDNTTVYTDAETAKTALTAFLATLSSYDSFLLTNRVITVSSDSATASVTRYYKYTLKTGTIAEDTGSWIAICKKISGVWKLSSMVKVSSSATESTTSGVTTTPKRFFGNK